LALGRRWQPSAWDRVQDAELAKSLAKRLAMGISGPVPRPVREVDLARLRASLMSGATELELDGHRKASVVQPPREEKSPDGPYRRWRLDTSDGQRIYVRL
jgi:hypothetical protein